MEALFLIFVGGALLSHAWYLLELYPDGRTSGLFTAGLGLASLIALTFDPMVLTGLTAGGEELAKADSFTETTILKGLIILWAGYGVGVGAHGLWDFDERALGFYCALVAIVSLVAMFYYAVSLDGVYGDGVWLGLTGAALVLTTLAGIMFFYLAIPFSVLRLVSAWFLLVGSAAVIVIGLSILTTAIRVTA